jgi:hypothetical protein
MLADDGGCICHKCAKAESYNILHSNLFGYKDGWAFQTAFINWEDTQLYCDNCGDRIESEYAED